MYVITAVFVEALRPFEETIKKQESLMQHIECPYCRKAFEINEDGFFKTINN